MEQLLTIKDVMALLQVGDETIYRWIRQKKIKATKIGGGWRIQPKSLEKIIDHD